ncbi:methyltransferase [Spongiibacter sp. KMU-158]|uniref:Methyltransferase n=1 Tax=Spongiibacter pelagi TaxID=2760804 RepID=A0A927C1K6_9GAMM|nr:50S ribosomal protein L11 methyltransferase [Spongiibacter pelagi]MBD2859588.1 methyltransferase [Spongiibacter pelagi]
MKRTNHAILAGLLGDILPQAEVLPTPLPLAPELSLYLLSEAYPQYELSAEQLEKIMNYPAYWCFCWASGQVMARYILDNPELVKNKRVIDFGAGSGVAAIAAAMAGAAEVVACDLDPDALLSSRENAALNHVELGYSDDFFGDEQYWDVILVADVLYDRANLPLLDVFLQRADNVLVADSRVKDFSVPGYRHLSFHRATTVPDLDESDEFSRVNLYLGEHSAA